MREYSNRFILLSSVITIVVVVMSYGTLRAKESDVETPLTGISSSVQPDLFTGTLTSSIPIAVPPGRNGMQPGLSIVYEGAGGNGWLGMGWKLENEGVSRQTRFGVDYSNNTGDKAFVVKMSGLSADLVQAPPPAPSSEWQAKIENSFSKLVKLTATDGQPYWKVTNKQGRKFYFGQTDASRVRDPNTTSKIFTWCLDRVEDPDGNYMTISYVRDHNQLYLDHIDYAGHGTTVQPTHVVKFYLEDRPDNPILYTTNFLIKTAKRLKTIEIKANSSLLRAYKLTYTQSSSISTSFLSGIQQFPRDASVNQSDGAITQGSTSPLPQLSTIQSNPTPGFTWKWQSPDTSWGSNQAIPGDFNGDGKTDMYLHAPQGSGNYEYLYLSTGTGFSWTWQSPNTTWSVDHIITGDYNGDGKTDLLLHAPSGSGGYDYLYLSTGTGFTWVWQSPDTSWSANQAIPGDYNGDGKTDLFLHAPSGSGGYDYLYLSTGTGFTWAWQSPDTSWSSSQPIAGDFNGDGKADVFLHAPTGSGGYDYLYLATGSGFSWTWQSPDTSWGSNQAVPGDFNGDGKTDIYLHAPAGSGNYEYLYLATGAGFSWTWQSPDTTWNVDQILTGDFNGDGKTDLYLHLPSGSGYDYLYLFNGSGFTWAWQSADTSWVGNQMLPADYSGDGKTDVYFHSSPAGSYDYFYESSGNVLGLLTVISNGLGSRTDITYAPSTQYTNTQLPFPSQTVSAITTCDHWNGASCAGMSATTAYTYSGGYYHIAERDLRGFNYAKATGPLGPNSERSVSETWFHQGNDTAVDVNTPNVTTGYMAGKLYRTRVSSGTGLVYSESTISYAADGDSAAPWFTPPQQVDSLVCDSGTCGSQTRTVFTYDHTYGHVTKEEQYGDLAASSDDRTITRTFGNNTTDWLISFPTSETISQGIPASTQVSKTDFYYDGTTTCATASTNQTPTLGHPTRTVRWLNGGTSPETRMAYDAYGNVTCSRDANGNTTTTTYDSTATYPTTVTNTLSHVVTTQYYGVDGQTLTNGFFGQVKSVTDPNTQTVTHEYDALGRKTKTTNPDGFWTTTTYPALTDFGQIGVQRIKGDDSLSLTSSTYFDGLGRPIKKTNSGPDSKTIVTESRYDARGAVRQTSLPYFQTGGSANWRTVDYDALGRMVQEAHFDGTVSKMCYVDRVTVAIDQNQHKKREVRDAIGRLVTVQEYTGTFSTCGTTAGTPYATTTYQYDVLGNLVAVTDAKGNVATMTFDTLSRKIAMHDPDMGDWSYVYDAVGNLTKQTDAKGQILWFRYDALNRRVQKDYTTQKTLGSGDVRYTYDGTTHNRKGRLQEVVDAAATVTLQYDSMGRITRTDKVLDSTTYTTESTYDGLGRMVSVTYPSSPVKTVTYAYNGPLLDKVMEGTTTYVQYSNYNALGKQGTATFGNGVTTNYTYSNTGNSLCTPQNFRLCTLVTTGSGGGSSGALSGSYTSTSSTVNLSTEGTTDWAHWGLTTATSFNHKSGITAQISNFSALGGGTAGRYDDNPAGYTWTGGTPTSSATNSTTGLYINDVNKGFQITVPADTTQRTLKIYVGAWGARGKLEAILSDSSASTYTDTSLNDAGGSSPGTARVYTLTYRAASASQTLTVNWTVDTMNEATWGNVTLQAATLTTSSGGSGGSTTYNAETDFSSTQGQQGWYYLSSTGSQLTWNGSFWAGTDGYIGLWNDGGYPGNSTNAVRRWVAPQAGSIQITGQAILAETCGGDGTTVTIKKNGTVLWTEALPIHTTVHSFNLSSTVTAGDHLEFVTNKNTDSYCDNTVFTPTIVLTSGTVYQDLRYSFDNEGNIVTITDAVNGNQSFSYDALDRLIAATGPYGSGGSSSTLSYDYDEIGNLTFNTQVGTYTYPTSGSSSVRPHAVTGAGANSYSYDSNGNMTSGAGRTLTYNLENKPLTVTISGQTTTFTYDGDGGRVKKVAGSTTTRYISKLYECDNTSCSRFIWAGSDRIATVGASGATYYYHGDHLGSSSVVTDGTGAKVQAVTYYPYGGTRTNTSPVTPTVDVPYKFTGKELDSSTSLYYYEARYYDPVLGRFLSADTIVLDPRDPQVLNRYSYVGNNPLTYLDPSGHFKIKFTKFLNRALGDVGITILGTVIQGMGPFGWANALIGGAILTQSESGRYVIATQMVVGTAIAAGTCIAASAGTCTPIAMAAVGAASGAAYGGYTASKNGGDLSSGLAFGSVVGGVTGAIGGQVGALTGPMNSVHGALASFKYAGLKMAAGAIAGAGSGASSGYAGGAGGVSGALAGAARGAATGAASGLAFGMIPVALNNVPNPVSLLPDAVKYPIAAVLEVMGAGGYEMVGKAASNLGEQALQYLGNNQQWVDALGVSTATGLGGFEASEGDVSRSIEKFCRANGCEADKIFSGKF